jgi:hypothetical protein
MQLLKIREKQRVAEGSPATLGAKDIACKVSFRQADSLAITDHALEGGASGYG